MDRDTLFSGKGRALEEAFFSQQNDRLLRELREQAAKRVRKDALARATGITTEAVIDKLVELEVTVERATAFSLVPLVELAWADGEIQSGEREAILEAAAERGIEPDSVPHQLLESWLSQPLDPQLLPAWEAYAEALSATLSPGHRQSLRRDLLDRAQSVAEAAGGLLGLGRISKEERAMLERLKRSFT